MTGPTDNNVPQTAGSNTAGAQGSFLPVTDASPAPAQPGEDMHRGWVKLWRKWQDHEMASDPNATLVFLHLLTESRREPKINRRYGYTLERGQCDLTLHQLADLTKLSVKAVRGALERLERYETIKRGTQKGKQPAIITLVNFDTYNPDGPGKGNHSGTSGAPQRADKGQLPENDKTAKKVENKTAVPELPTALDPYKAAVEDWLAYKRERGQTYKPRGLKALYTSMVEMGAGLPAAVQHSMAHNYAGLFQAGKGGNGSSARQFDSAAADRADYIGR